MTSDKLSPVSLITADLSSFVHAVDNCALFIPTIDFQTWLVFLPARDQPPSIYEMQKDCQLALAPPEPFTSLLFCSWACSIGILEYFL